MRFLKISALLMVMLASAILMLGVLSMRGIPARGGSVPGAFLNGDVNCDGRVDISDAIAVIQFQFYGGTPPCAIAEDPTVLDKLANLQIAVDSLARRLPAPEDILLISGQAHFPSAGGTKVIYQVPADKWFVLTAIGDSTSVPPTLFSILNGNSMEVGRGVQVPHSNAFTWPSGFAIPPGAEVALQNSEDSRPSDASYFMHGHLVGGR